MHVSHGVVGHLIVNDVGDVVHVDTAGGDIRRDENFDLLAAEGVEGLFPRGLRHIPVDRADEETALGEVVGHVGGGALGARENDGPAAIMRLQNGG